MTRTTLHARCAIVVSSAMMRVQNYACSRIKRGSCCESALQADMRSVCVICTTVGQYFNLYRVSHTIAEHLVKIQDGGRPPS